MATKRYKVVLLGEGRVGKTSILLRYIRNEYDDRQVSTLQASYLDKKLSVENQNVQLSLWDTAGQERFHALGPIYYRDADGALLVYDITDDESFKKVKTWVKELRRIVGDEIDIAIAGNKIDLKRNIKVTEADAVAYAKSVGATHFYTSAKLNRGLDDVFVDLAKRMLSRGGASRSKKNKANAFVADDDAPTPSAAPTTTTSAAAMDARNRDGARGNTIQIVDDHRPTRGSPHHGSAKKSGCC
ncbi:Ras-like protein Rab-21 [Saprolegnia diclina VS20]|uniref:Ras-related protein Rab-21 n=1 Tax=Saprolegnia diclina (strain VS20) TaxID=1156394 RepID=T0R7S8_SAPDV|nr:Ras-like protein Rab-21 [Saprolegnia diclina VS20]EQC42510.1 Ras-like protein Rab-21 [Saprolegnia diclina VS20]|eukprot:XP_008603933.1 Ras-like protein Rab-21 [Saprolegnia diclina VS20]